MNRPTSYQDLIRAQYADIDDRIIPLFGLFCAVVACLIQALSK